MRRTSETGMVVGLVTGVFSASGVAERMSDPFNVEMLGALIGRWPTYGLCGFAAVLEEAVIRGRRYA